MGMALLQGTTRGPEHLSCTASGVMPQPLPKTANIEAVS